MFVWGDRVKGAAQLTDAGSRRLCFYGVTIGHVGIGWLWQRPVHDEADTGVANGPR